MALPSQVEPKGLMQGTFGPNESLRESAWASIALESPSAITWHSGIQGNYADSGVMALNIFEVVCHYTLYKDLTGLRSTFCISAKISGLHACLHSRYPQSRLDSNPKHVPDALIGHCGILES